MAATVELSESNGLNNAEAVTDGITNINFGTTDAPNLVAASFPIIIGGFSFGKWFRFHLVSLNGSNHISNIRAWKSSGVLVTGEVIGANFGGIASFAYTVTQIMITLYAHQTATSGAALVTTPVTGNGLTVLPQSYANIGVPTSLPGAENLAIGGGAGGTLSSNNTYSNYAFIGLATTGSTPAGAVNQKVFSVTYDET